MYYLVKWVITAEQHILPEETVKGFTKCCIPSLMVSLVLICCGMAVGRVGILGWVWGDKNTGCKDGDSDSDW